MMSKIESNLHKALSVIETTLALNFNKGKHHSDETKQKMSEARKRYWEKRKRNAD